MFSNKIINNLSYIDKENFIKYTYEIDKNNFPSLTIYYTDYDETDTIYYNIEEKKWEYHNIDYDLDVSFSNFKTVNKYLFPNIWHATEYEFIYDNVKNFNNNSLKLLSPISIYNYLKYDIKIKKIILTLFLILKDILPIEMIDKILSFNMIIDFN